ncbi:protein SEC13 homolog isoform X1 [Corvus cornix cornix]|uniref:protein SEC13 homolog isoform X1 n=1 Tax=Corvus cornix cornix TaxID=932674 RepID=UPI0019527EA1|nr:protein SEC13 homolog isoform X1 [Corvus cornix cornix]
MAEPGSAGPGSPPAPFRAGRPQGGGRSRARRLWGPGRRPLPTKGSVRAQPVPLPVPRAGQVSVINTVDTSHEDMIHDAQMDYYGTRLATCSSDRSVKIFDVRNGGQILIADLRGHEGPVWQVAWAHPMYGNILASCSYDRKVIIWKEENGTWEKTYEYTGHDSSVNSVCWAPHDYGLILACGSSDGAISLLSYTGDGQWEVKKISNAHTIGCNAVSWAPAVVPGSLIEQPSGQKPNYIKRFASGGCDNLVKIWKEEDGQWKEEQKLEAHSDWVRDVAWAPSIGLPTSTIASCSQDGRVFIWTCDDASGNSWSPKLLHKFNDVVWHVSWSITANILAVSGGDNKVTLWKESVDGLWACISDVNKGQGGVSAVIEGQQNEQ